MVALVSMPGMRSRAFSGAWRPVHAEDGTQPIWTAAVGALGELLGSTGIRHARATIILSDHVVRYLVLPWNKELSNESERVEYARARFEQIHGDTARGWQVRIGNGVSGSARLAAAVDSALLEALRKILRLRNITMESCQPALTALVDGADALIGNDAWVIAAERGRINLAHLLDGKWNSVRTRPLGDGPVVLEKLIAQERLLVAGAEADCKVFVNAVDNLLVEPGVMRAVPLVPTRYRGRLAADIRDKAALAMAGMR